MSARLRFVSLGVLLVGVAVLSLLVPQDDRLDYDTLERMYHRSDAAALRSAMDDELLSVHFRQVAARFLVRLSEGSKDALESELVRKRDMADSEASSAVYRVAIDVISSGRADTNKEDLFSRLSALALHEYEPGYHRLTETEKYSAVELDTGVDAIVVSTFGSISTGRRFFQPTSRPELQFSSITFESSLSGLTKRERDAIYANVRHVGLVATRLITVANYSPCVGTGYQKYAYLYLVDVDSGQILSASRLEGGMPPLEVAYGAGEPCDHTGDMPDYKAYFRVD